MSLTALASSFANTYVNAPNHEPHLRAMNVSRLGAAGAAAAFTAPEPADVGGNGGQAAVVNAGAGAGGGADTSAESTLGDNLKALTDYIPSEILTLYIGMIAAIQSWPFKDAAGTVLSGDALAHAQTTWLEGTFWGCLIAAPVWVAIGVILTSKTRPSWQPFVWPMIVAPIAFSVYALAIPKSWLADTLVNGGLFATMLLLLIAPILHTGTLLYTKLFPPLPAQQ